MKYDDMIDDIHFKDDKIMMYEELEKMINDKLIYLKNNLKNNIKVTIKYYNDDNEKYEYISSIVKSVDDIERVIKLANKIIDFSDIADITIEKDN